MGGALPFPSPPTPTMQDPSIPSGPYGRWPWPPFTPRHQHHPTAYETPRSVATEPPTSPFVGSDYSDSVPSSPTKRSVHDRGRPPTQSQTPKHVRPKSAIRGSKTPSRSRPRTQRRVSFSSPEATQIEDHAYEVVNEDVIELNSSEAEDSDFERRRIRREAHASRSLQLHSRKHERAQTPGPPSHPLVQEDSGDELQRPGDSESRPRIAKNARGSSSKGQTTSQSSRKTRR